MVKVKTLRRATAGRKALRTLKGYHGANITIEGDGHDTTRVNIMTSSIKEVKTKTWISHCTGERMVNLQLTDAYGNITELCYSLMNDCVQSEGM